MVFLKHTPIPGFISPEVLPGRGTSKTPRSGVKLNRCNAAIDKILWENRFVVINNVHVRYANARYFSNNIPHAIVKCLCANSLSFTLCIIISDECFDQFTCFEIFP